MEIRLKWGLGRGFLQQIQCPKQAEVVIISDCLYTNWVEDSVAPLALTLNAALGADADRAARQKQVGPEALVVWEEDLLNVVNSMPL